MNLNKISVAGLSLLLVIMTSTNCFASSKTQEIKTLEFDKTIAIEDIEQYKSNIENDIFKRINKLLVLLVRYLLKLFIKSTL